MKEKISSNILTDSEWDMFEGTLQDVANLEKLATLLCNIEKLDVTLYEKIKKDYLESNYKHECVKQALVDKYAPANYSTWYLNFVTKEISYYATEV